MMMPVSTIEYDEFSLLHENASEFGLPWAAAPRVGRTSVEAYGGSGHISALVWGDGEPELVLIHGSAQNAHTWDTVALALGRPLVSFDLPGHGHTSWKNDQRYDPRSMAADLAPVVADLAPRARAVVGMSLGGMTALALAAAHPELVERLVLVDITPGTNREKAKAIIDFVNGPQSFPDFDAILARTIEHNPTRSVSSLRRGILHNARQLPDGSWQWRYDRTGRPGSEAERGRVDPGELWNDVGGLTMPLLLARGGTSPVVDDADVAELLRVRPDAEVVVVEGAGHSIQGDRPLELAALIERFVFGELARVVPPAP